MSRPELPTLKPGDTLIMRSGVRGRREATEVRVVSVGRKYVYVVGVDRFDGYDATRDRWLARRFLLADQQEGTPGTRVGYPTSIATAEQHAYDVEQDKARAYLTGQGISIENRSPARGREIALAAAVKAVLDA